MGVLMGRRRFGSVRQLPSGRWQARYRDLSGRTITADTTFDTARQADAYLAEIQTRQRRGDYVDPRAGHVTFNKWATDWLAQPGRRPNTVARHRTAIRSHLGPSLGTMRLAAIQPKDVQDTVRKMQAAGLSPQTVRSYVGTLAAIMQAAVDADLLIRNPVRTRTLGLEKVEHRERPALTPADLQRLAAELAPRYRALVLTGGVLGLRWGEVIGLRKRDVNFLRRTVTVAQTVEEVAGKVRVVSSTKTAASRRTVAAPAFLIEALAAHVAEFRADADGDDLLFVGQNGAILRRNFQARHFAPAAQRAGLEGLTFHGLRHAAASLMVANGEHPRVVQARLGHADPGISMGLYSHIGDDVDRQAADRLDQAFRSSAGGGTTDFG